MKVVTGYPPNMDEIAAALPGALEGGTIFCYGDTVYTPGGGRLSASLRAHEAVHSRRQGKTDAEIRAWWKKYLADERFRFDEEVPAHRAEYADFCKREKDKQKRFRCLVEIAIRLSGPLYGEMVAFDKAKRLVRGDA